MPIIPYVCGDCGRIDEYLLRSSEETPESCTSCGYEGKEFERVWHGAGFSAVTSKTQITLDGHKHLTRNRDGALEGMAGMKPGVNIARGINELGKPEVTAFLVGPDKKPIHGVKVHGPYSTEEFS